MVFFKSSQSKDLMSWFFSWDRYSTAVVRLKLSNLGNQKSDRNFSFGIDFEQIAFWGSHQVFLRGLGFYPYILFGWLLRVRVVVPGGTTTQHTVALRVLLVFWVCCCCWLLLLVAALASSLFSLSKAAQKMRRKRTKRDFFIMLHCFDLRPHSFLHC